MSGRCSSGGPGGQPRPGKSLGATPNLLSELSLWVGALGVKRDDRATSPEAVATQIRSYYIRYLPGPLQTPEYATALTGSFEDIPQDRIDMLLEARRLRRAALLERLGTLKYFAVFDESVFMRTTGGPVVFAAQLRELQRLAEKDLIHLRMLPFSLDTPIANNASFDLLSLGDGAEGNQVLYRENGLTDELVEEKDSTSRHLARFSQLWEVATDESDTIEFIKRRTASLESTVTNGEQLFD